MPAKMKIITSLVVLAALTGFPLIASAEQGGAESIIITIDRAVMPVTLYHPGLQFTKPAVLTVRDFLIRDYSGKPINSFIVQQASARVEVPIETVKEIRQAGWISKNTKDIENISYVVPVVMTLTNGRVVETLMNADFGTIEGSTSEGAFFLGDPHTVTCLVFNR